MAFGVLRILAVARLLWGDRWGVSLESLAVTVDASLEDLHAALASVVDEGLAAIDASSGTVRLAERGVTELLVRQIPRSGAARHDIVPAVH